MAIYVMASPMRADTAKLVAPWLPGLMRDSTYKVELLQLVLTEDEPPQETVLAEASTDATHIYITDHNLAVHDMIVNTTCRLTSDAYGNRGSRYVKNATNPNMIVVDTVTGQAVNDWIRLYKYSEIEILKPGTFRLVRKGTGQSTLEFQIITDKNFLIRKGQFIRVVENCKGVESYVFWGTVASHDEELLGKGQTVVLQSVSCESLNSITGGRTVTLDEAYNTNYATIVTSMITKYLYAEGITAGTIDSGAIVQEDWTSDAVSIKEVLAECASKSGFECYIDENCALHFHRDYTPALASHALRPDMTQVDAWRNYTKLKLSSQSSEYYNKMFFVGGLSETGDSVVLFRDDSTEINAQQDYAAGTGAFGLVIRDTSKAEADFRTAETGSATALGVTTINITGHAQNVGDCIWSYTTNEFRTVLTTPTADQFTVDALSSIGVQADATAEAGTTTTNIKITAHGRAIGEMIYNATVGEYRFIQNVVDADNFTVKAITGQVATDSIKLSGHIIGFFGEINNILSESLKKQSIDPTTLSFSTPEKFVPQTKLIVDIPEIGQTDQTYFIDDVEIYDLGKGLGDCWYNVKATKRNAVNFSVQRKLSYLDFWRDF